MSDYKPLSRATFNRWKDAIFSQFGIIILAKGWRIPVLYRKSEDIDEDELKMDVDSFTVSNLISENLSLKDRILVSHIPSAQYLTLLEMKKIVSNNYCAFKAKTTFPIEPYYVNYLKNRYVLAHNVAYNDIVDIRP